MPKTVRVNVFVTISFFLPQSYVFILKLRESLLKSLKITLKKIVKSILRCRKTINSPKMYFWEKQLQMICKRHSLQLAQMTTTTTFTSFSLLSVNKFKSFLLNLAYKTHGKCFIVYCRVVDMNLCRDILGRLLSSKNLRDTLLKSSACSMGIWARSRYWIWLSKYSSYVVILIYHYSFKTFLRFWLAKIPHINHHKQLL